MLRVGEAGSLRGGETGLLRGPSAFELLIMLQGLAEVSENLHDEEGVEHGLEDELEESRLYL